MYKSLLTLALLGTFTASAMAQNTGKVTFIGEIVDSPCSIASESVDQTVDLGQIANTALANGGISSTKNFTIELENCAFAGDWADKNKATITFAGGEAFDKLLGITGFADPVKGANVGIQINDSKNNQVKIGEAVALSNTLQNGSNTLLFSSFVKGNGAAVTDIPLGKFTGVTNFTITYN